MDEKEKRTIKTEIMKIEDEEKKSDTSLRFILKEDLRDKKEIEKDKK